MAYIGSTWVATAMWPVMMQTILILNVQEKNMWRKLASLLGEWWQHQSRMGMPCHAYWLTTQVSSPQKVHLNLNQPLPDDWCNLISQNHIMPALFDHDFGGNRERGWTWCLSIWSPSYHQFQLGLLKYILTSLFHFCSVPCHFLEWLDKWSSPDVPSIELPGSISRSCPSSNEYDSPDGGHTKGGRKRKNVLLKQLTLIAGLSYKRYFWTGSRHAKVQGTIRQHAKICAFQSEFWKSYLHCEWLLGMSKQS